MYLFTTPAASCSISRVFTKIRIIGVKGGFNHNIT